MKRNRWDKAACEAMSEVSSFLGGIFFASILMVIQQKKAFSNVLLKLEISKYSEVIINELHIVMIPLALSIVMFIFSAIRFAGACSLVDSVDVDYSARPAYAAFRVAFISMLISLSVILLLTDVLVGLCGILFILIAGIYFAKRDDSQARTLEKGKHR